MEDIIRDFWRCSLKSDFSDFCFDSAFNCYHPFLSECVVSHGLGTFEEFQEWWDNMFGLNHLECLVPEEFTIETNWVTFSDVDVVEAVLRARHKLLRETFSHNVHGDLADLLERLNNRKNLTEPELIELFDECIHAQHATGDILYDIDVESLREEEEEEHKNNQKKFPTEIRKFLAKG